MRPLAKTKQPSFLTIANTWMRCGLTVSLLLATMPADADPGAEKSILVKPSDPDQGREANADAPRGTATNRSDDADRLEPIPAGADHQPGPTPAHLDEEPTPADSASHDLAGAAKEGEAIVAEASHFHGIQPGTTTVEDLLASWGAPTSEAANGALASDQEENDGFRKFVYQIEPFRRIEVHAEQGVVSLIQIELAKPLGPSLLAKQLDLGDCRTTIVRDESGEALGIAYPERGVLMTLAPGSERPQVTHVLVEKPTAEPFVLRAESRPPGQYAESLRDLRYGLQLNPKSAKAKWLLAEIYLATGQPTRAEAVAEAAVSLEPNNPTYLVRHMQTLIALGRHTRAIEASKRILNNQPAPLAKAQTLEQIARLAALGSHEDAQRAVSLFNQSIQVADQLATSHNRSERRAAKNLLVDCHLAIAEQIARGDWQKKPTVVPKWIGRASSFAEELIENEGGGLELRLRVAQHALAALSEFQPMPDPTEWILEAEDAATELLDASDDEMWQRQIHWQLGMAYFHALHIAHVRGSADEALEFGRNAVTHLGQGAQSREALPANEHLVGRLYFRMGAVHAIHQQDHEKAVAWYKKAIPLLKQPVPVSQYADPRRHGDALISMGVSYWQTGKEEAGLELTEFGTNILAEANQSGLVESTALTVAYNNLATMHQELGNDFEAKQYSRLAHGKKTENGKDPLRR